MANKKLWLGILVMVLVLVFGTAVTGCEEKQSNGKSNGIDNRLILEDGYAWVGLAGDGFIFKKDGTYQHIEKYGGNIFVIKGVGIWSTDEYGYLDMIGSGVAGQHDYFLYTVTETTLSLYSWRYTKMAVIIQ